jgi:hypothetical protein
MMHRRLTARDRDCRKRHEEESAARQARAVATTAVMHDAMLVTAAVA